MHNKFFIYVVRFFTVGWSVSLLALLPFVQKIYSLTLIDIGYVSMALTVTSIFSAFLTSKINKAIGNKSLLVSCLLLQTFSWALFLAPKLPICLWTSFILAGISSGLIEPVMSAIIARNAKPNERAKEIGDFGAVGDMGRVGVTAIVTFLFGVWSLHLTALVQTTITIMFAVSMFFINFDKRQVKVGEEKVNVGFAAILKSRKYILAILAGIFDTFSSSSIFIFLPFLLMQKNINIASTGIFTSLFFAGYFVGRIFLGRFGDKHGKAKVLIFAELCMGVFIISLIFINSYMLIILNIFLLGVFTRGTVPLIKAMVADGLSEHQFESGYSLHSSIMRTANALSRPSYSFVGSYFGISSIFVLSAIIASLTVVPAGLFYKNKK